MKETPAKKAKGGGGGGGENHLTSLWHESNVSALPTAFATLVSKHKDHF